MDTISNENVEIKSSKYRLPKKKKIRIKVKRPN